MGEHEINRAVFLDRDGVLNRPVVRDGRPLPPAHVDEFELYPDAAAACARLKAAGFLLVVVTNQPDVGRGTQTREIVEAMHAKLRAAVPSLDAIEVCFHAGAAHGEPCECRKPAPGMVLRAAAALDIDLKQSFLVGDRWRDVDCAHAAGSRAVFIDRGYREALREKPEFTVSNLGEAVGAILNAAPQNRLSGSSGRD
ncbi:MAG TPA: HAD-IIIA family hydrolase [Chthoniobacterales bacterium]|nr:HAD-IIIA family hydrolase [Chthoniobacterales bacterium]